MSWLCDCVISFCTLALSQRTFSAHEKGLVWVTTGLSLSLQKNITEAYQFTKQSQKSMKRIIRIAIPENKTVHNYSTQTMNSTELAKKQMLQEMAKVSDRAAG